MKSDATPKVLPEDRYNDILVSNVSPPGWKNPEPRPRYDLVVIGAGPAGLVAAAGAAGLGAGVALIERHLLGGDCLNVGCVPSKCIIRSSRAAADARAAGRFGIRIPDGLEVDFPAVMERMRRLRSEISAGDSLVRFQGLGVDVFLGEGRFTGQDMVEVDKKTLRFEKALIATGARAVAQPIEGLAEAGYLTNETVFSLTQRPSRLAVIGGGPLGSELAQAFGRMGSKVSIFHKHDHLLNREDYDAARILQRTFLEEGIELYLNARLVEVSLTGEGKRITFERNGRSESVVVDEILLGMGRSPNVEELGLEAAGVGYDTAKGVAVNDRLQTSNPRIYAAGDICLPYKFTHAADATARIVIQNALFLGRKKMSALTIPWCTYTDPEIAHVGLSEAEAGEKGIRVDAFVKSFGLVDRAIADGETEGFVKVLVQRGSDRILGATIVARHAGEMINEISLAMAGGLGLGAIAGVIHPYPTQAEAIRQVADEYNRTRLTPLVKKILSIWLALRRSDLKARGNRLWTKARNGISKTLTLGKKT